MEQRIFDDYLFVWPQPSNVVTHIAQPNLGRIERDNINFAFDSTWIGANGKYTQDCEDFLNNFFDSKSLLVSNGSVALILALRALGVGTGDEVIVPDLTYAATASAVVAIGAKPVFCEVEKDTWFISLSDIKKKVSERTKAIIVVHLYGMPGNLSLIQDFVKSKGLFLIEDCAESFGAEFGKTKVGEFGDISTFSFFPNKLLTSGEGGAVITKSEQRFDSMKLLRGQGMSPTQRYLFLEPGYNFRISELQAALLNGQFKRLTELWKFREESENYYRENLGKNVSVPGGEYLHKRSPWLFTARLKGISAKAKFRLASNLARIGIETRPVFYPLSRMPAFFDSSVVNNPTCDLISMEGISLPTGLHVSKQTQDIIIEEVLRYV